MKILGSLIFTVVELLIVAIRCFVTHAFNYNRNVQSLRTHLSEELSDTKTRVLHSEDNVGMRLASVNVIIEEANRVFEDEDEVKKRCLMEKYFS
jgi:hypothetical protein